jgi:hypothetical protein
MKASKELRFPVSALPEMSAHARELVTCLPKQRLYGAGGSYTGIVVGPAAEVGEEDLGDESPLWRYAEGDDWTKGRLFAPGERVTSVPLRAI